MFGFDDAMMAAFAEEAAMTEGVNTALQAQQAAEAAAAASAAANAAATANELSMAQAAGLGAVGGAGAAGAGTGITQASMASNVLAGGEGAGAAGINPAQVAAGQNAATAIPNSGITEGATRSLAAQPAGITQAPFTNTGEFYEAGSAPGVRDPSFDIANAQLDAATKASGSSFFNGMKSFGNFVDEYPKSAAAAAYLTAYHSGLLDPRNNLSGQGSYSGPLSAYKMSPNFQGRFANPQDYQPTLRRFQSGGIADVGGGPMPVEAMSKANAIGMNTGYPQADITGHAYATPWQTPVSENVVQGTADTGVNRMSGQMLASGGIVGFARGGDTSRALDFYRQMYSPDRDTSSAPAPARGPLAGGLGHDPGIYYDMDPDTRYQDALTAAQIRNAKVAKRANMQMPTGKRPTPMGSINLRPPGAQAEQAQSSLDPENAAQGGIMQARSSLGGYAAGGNPRLLKGPGDGMSDNIPATIAGKQPARLADGEFVIPADVVSHLGNGSTEAGAKKLHSMMDNVRKARTGRKAQGKQINPNKFMPK